MRLLTLLTLLACSGSSDKAGSTAESDADADADTDADTDSDADADADTDADPAEPELWLYLQHNLQVEENVEAVEALIDRAADAGYHGIVLSDFKINLLHSELLAHWYTANLGVVLDKAAERGLAVVPAIFPFGYSEGIYYGQPDLAEGAPVVGARFAVSADGARLEPVPEYSGPPDGGFEQHSGDAFSAWSWQDDAGTRTFADESVFRSGASSLRIGPGSSNARAVVALDLEPRRQYHLSYWIRTAGFAGDYTNAMVLDTATGRALTHDQLVPAADQGWTRYDTAFTTHDTGEVSLYLGVWGTAAGLIWFDDVSVEETALVNLVRRDGAPLAAWGPGGEALAEGTDFLPISDPQTLVAFDPWHEPPAVALPPGTSLSAGDAVTMDFYAVTPVYGYQVGACLTAAGVSEWMAENLAAVDEAFPEASGFMLSYDEMRQMNSCASCAGRGKTAGELLAWHVGESTAMVEAIRPDATIYAWSDMFDPHHNAVDTYYLVEGSVAGSWEGLPAEVVLMNWNLGSADSLAFFADRGHEQIIAGYYDSGDGAGSAVGELGAAAGVSGVRGLMYTTWSGDYSQLEAYAEGARSSW